MDKLKDFIKSKDYYGYLVTVSFNNSGASHCTIFGGICSLITRGLIWMYTILLLMRYGDI